LPEKFPIKVYRKLAGITDAATFFGNTRETRRPKTACGYVIGRETCARFYDVSSPRDDGHVYESASRRDVGRDEVHEVEGLFRCVSAVTIQ